MARKPRVVIEGGVYHVYNRAASGEAVFAGADEASGFIELLRRVKKRDGWTLFAWALMSNHYHLVVRTSTIPLWRGMHGIQNGFSRSFNRRHGRTGGLWQSRYQARYVGEQDYLDRLVLYVHLNPVEAGLVEDPAKYPLAGHWEVVRRVREPLLDVDDMLLCFGTTRRAARRRYLAAVRAGFETDPDGAGEDWHPFADHADLGVSPAAAQVDVLGRSSGRERPQLEAEEFVRLACRVAEIDLEGLVSRARDSRTARDRKLIATLGAERWRQSRKALAEALDKNPDVVSWWVGEGARLRSEDPSFAARLEDLDDALTELTADVAKSERTSF